VQVLETLTILLIFLSLLFAVFLLGAPSKNKLGNNILAIFLIIRAVDASSLLHHHFNVPFVLDQFRHDLGAFLQEPMIYLFVLSIVYSDFKLRKVQLYHLIPLILSLVVWMPNLYLPHFGIGVLQVNYEYYVEFRFTYLLGALQKIFYIILTYWVIFRFKKLYEQNYSSTKPFNYQWLLTMNHFFVALFIIASTKNIVKFSDMDEYITIMRSFTIFIMLFFTCWLVLKALYSPQIFKGISHSLKVVEKREPNNIIDKELSGTVQKQILNLEAYLKKHEPFLDPDLTIGDLAASMRMDAKELSLLINKNMGQNFYNLMSHYRIEKAKNLLSDPTNNHLNVLEILYNVGFNSKSSFNQAFKKSTGLTPTDYRKQYY